MLYAAIATALFAFSAVATFVLGSQLPAMAVFPVPVALYMVRRMPYRAVGLALVSGIAASTGMISRWVLLQITGSPGEAETGSEIVLITIWPGLYQALFSSAGLLVGWGIVRRWTYGRVVYATTAVVFGLTLVHDMLLWQEWTSQAESFLGAFEETLAQQATQQGISLPSAQRDVIAQLKENWPNIAFGTNYLAILAVTCLAVTLTAAGLRKWLGEPGPVGSFMTMRPTEWLIWAVIGVAGLWFWDHYSPNEAVRFVAWNAAVGLAAVYWFNGLGIMVYGSHVLRPPVAVVLAVLILIVLLDMRVFLLTFGLFDTWADFRTKCDAFAASRKAREEDDS
ncbi:MAG: hypothetical protein AMXMBFR84_09130 [Candidatus Hydrogenedentota bacterium]